MKNTKLSSRNYDRYKHMLVFIVAFLAALSAGLSLSRAAEIRRLAEKKKSADHIVQIQADRISHAIDNLLSITQTLRALLMESSGSIRDFSALMPDIVGNSPVRCIALAPGGTITQVYPYEGNEAAIGHELLHDPERTLEASIAKESGRLTLSGPYELRQGGVGIIGRLPVYLKDEYGKNFFWGFTCITIDIPDGLSQANIGNLEKQGYSYELWRISPEDGKHQTIMKSGLPLSANPLEREISLPNSTWYLSITPAEGWLQADVIVLEVVLTGLFALLCGLLAMNVAVLADSRHNLFISLRQQSDNYSLLNHLNEDLRIFRHDSHNHMLSLSNLLEKGDLDAARSYIRTISGTLADTVRICNTDNYVFDALLAQKLYEARQKGIHTEQEIAIDRQLSIENGDWSAVFGNALDNAIEACLQPEVTDPEIRVYVRQSGDLLRVCITNSANRPQKPKEDFFPTTKADRRNHGLGFKQIKSVVKKYHGTVEASWRDGVFSLSFLLLYV